MNAKQLFGHLSALVLTIGCGPLAETPRNNSSYARDAMVSTGGQGGGERGDASGGRQGADNDTPSGGAPASSRDVGGVNATDRDSDADLRDPGPIGEAIGNACNNFTDCPPGGLDAAICLADHYVDGYCSAACVVDEDCPGEGVCVGRFCLAACETNDDCRPHYRCKDEFSEGPAVCIPSTTALSGTGERCAMKTDCQGSILDQVCAPHSETHMFCTGTCLIDADCPADSICAIGNDTAGNCVKSCESSMECEAGFACYDFIELLTRRDGSTARMSRAGCYPIGEGNQQIGETCSGRGDCEGGRRALCSFADSTPMCSRLCNAENPCPADTRCAFENPDSGEGYCFRNCDSVDDCAAGLICEDADGTEQRVCTNGGAGDKKSGEPCASVSECTGGRGALCIAPSGTDDRICTRRCSFKNACPRGEHCAQQNELEVGFCLPNCEPGQAGECEDGQACFDLDLSGDPVCYPAPFARFDVPLGGACRTRDECEAGFYCSSQGMSGVVGLCTKACRTNTDCGETAHCALIDAQSELGVCVQTCENQGECDDDLVCEDAYDRDGLKECAVTSRGTGRVGDPCMHMGQCNGGHRAQCVRSANWTSRGYCIVNDCTAEAGCPSGSHCSLIDSTTNRGVCLADCRAGMRCDFDLACTDIDGDDTMECVPQTSGTSNIGGGCTSARDCQSSICLDAGNPRGMCSAPCLLNTDCPAGTHCETYADDAGLCLPNCDNDGDCRTGYVCTNLYSTAVTTCVGLGAGDNEVGEPCRSSTDCARGMRAACLGRSNGWSNGYCLKYQCDRNGGCSAGTHCGFYSPFNEDGGYCMRSCANDADCLRSDYECYDFDGDGLDECAPIRPEPLGTGRCAALDVCMAACNQYDAGCRANCYTRSTSEAVEAWNRMVGCQTATACEFNDAYCRVETCATDRAACYGLSAVPNGEGTCLELESCLRRCDTDEPRCRPECIAAASPAAYQAYETVMACRAVRSVDDCEPEISACSSD
ncbi:MAG: hypothetical protein VX589_12905 [Myxococcota bacterium]|nr:hypothetical protein [Myxococcota bacterium]